MKRKISAMLLALAMVLALLPMTALADGAGSITTDKKVYSPNEPITISFSIPKSNDPGDPFGPRIQLFPKGDSGEVDTGVLAFYTDTTESPYKDVIYGHLSPGEYELRAYRYVPAQTLLATCPITVAYKVNDTANLAADKQSYAPQEAMTITVTGMSEAEMASDAHVSYCIPGKPSDENYSLYGYITKENGGVLNVHAPSSSGTYELRLYAHKDENADSLYRTLTIKVEGASGGEITKGQSGISDWALTEVNAAIKDGLTTEKVLSSFQDNITREEFCELAVKLYEALSASKAEAAPADTFNDTNNPEILKAYKLGIVNGVGESKFAPGSPITRQEIAVMLIRTVKVAVPTLDITAPAATFSDSAAIADWAKEAVSYFSAKGIIKGAGGAFMPKANTTREAGVALVKRTFDYFSQI